MIPTELYTPTALFVFLQVLDVALTISIIHGGGVELNPILPNHPGLHVLVKAAIVTAIALDGRAVPLATVLTACAVLWNGRQVYLTWRRRAQEAQ